MSSFLLAAAPAPAASLDSVLGYELFVFVCCFLLLGPLHQGSGLSCSCDPHRVPQLTVQGWGWNPCPSTSETQPIPLHHRGKLQDPGFLFPTLVSHLHPCPRFLASWTVGPFISSASLRGGATLRLLQHHQFTPDTCNAPPGLPHLWGEVSGVPGPVHEVSPGGGPPWVALTLL